MTRILQALFLAIAMAPAPQAADDLVGTYNRFAHEANAWVGLKRQDLYWQGQVLDARERTQLKAMIRAFHEFERAAKNESR